ncbi:MAG: zinc-dependent metalloprotease [Leptolyngbyaceae cyanobacterium MO_188.B28]|nr:zinc-dependent metalloprotease [Leptolyngbyaceae cyanobacterium MO_188.B28]
MKKLPILIAYFWGIIWGSGPLYAQSLSLTSQVASTIDQHFLRGDRVGADQPLSYPLQSLVKTEEDELQASKSSDDETNGDGDASTLKPFDETVKGLKKDTGLFTVYRKPDTGKTYLAIKPEQLNQNILLVATLEAGIGEAGLFSGWPISDLVFQFRRGPNNKLHLVVPNIYFRTEPNQSIPQQLLQRSFSDSVLYALGIVSIHPEDETLLIDLGDLFINRDLAGLKSNFPEAFGSYSPNQETSYLEQIKTFPLNVEIESVYGFTSSGVDMGLFSLGNFSFPSLPDPRGFSIRVRYSLSHLPANNGYRPRLADDRVGYFITAYQTPLDYRRRDPFVRYIQRWRLEKRNSEVELSPPKEPIVFWIENTVPLEYRQAIREGALLWNEAFEQAGFLNAIEVRQMPDNADWDPADVRYNTIRWSHSLRPWALALGPSRVNPLTGQILDSDIIIDASVIRLLLGQYQTLVPEQSTDGAFHYRFCDPPFQRAYQNWAELQTGAADPFNLLLGHSAGFSSGGFHRREFHAKQCFSLQAARQVGFGALAIRALQLGGPDDAALDEYIQQFLRSLTAHEVGHALGLRHNFRGSLLLTAEELHNPEITRSRGLISSVMDYFPVNLAPPDTPQGDYFPTRLGPYDLWAIEYGYKPLETLIPQLEQRALATIAQRATTSELAYATDEDSFDAFDPEAKPWDMGRDPIQFSHWQMDNALAIWERLDTLYRSPNESYGDLRQQFDTVLGYYFTQALTIANYVGGRRFNRQRPGTANGRLPFEPIAIERQRQALEIVQDYVFAADSLEFSSDLLNQLAPDRWSHWGQAPVVFGLDYPIHDRILFYRCLVLSELLTSSRLARIRDEEYKASPGDALTLPELFEALQAGIWTEVMQDQSETMTISSLRRGLQRQYLNILANMVVKDVDAVENARTVLDFIVAINTYNPPEDARVLARYQLGQLQEAIARSLDRQGSELDLTAKSHLEDAHHRITQILNAPY